MLAGKSKQGEGKTLTIILTRGPFISDYSDIAINTALRAKKMGYKVNLFLYLDGTWNAHVKTDKKYSNPGEWLRWCIKKGVKVAACERCSEARDLVKEDIIDGVEIGGVYRLLDMIKGSDKVLSFMG